LAIITTMNKGIRFVGGGDRNRGSSDLVGVVGPIRVTACRAG